MPVVLSEALRHLPARIGTTLGMSASVREYEEMERDERVFLLGEDINKYGGAYAVTEPQAGSDVGAIETNNIRLRPKIANFITGD